MLVVMYIWAQIGLARLKANARDSAMSDDAIITALCDAPGSGTVKIRLSAENILLSVEEARRFQEMLRIAVNSADLVCEDCGRKDNTVESSGCPDGAKHGEPAPATLCNDCFFKRDQWSTD